MSAMKLKALLSMALILAGLAAVTSANADTLVDRGLPTDNLNDAAGAKRSNVSWLFTQYTPKDYWLVGDTFSNTTSQTWLINTIRLWTVGTIVQNSTATLWGGVEGSNIGVVSTDYSASGDSYAVVPYTLYQGISNPAIEINQINFAVNITLAPGKTYDFFLDGTDNGDFVVPFVHASNAALSGNIPQDGSDDLMLYAEVVNGSIDSASVGTWSSFGNGWDKASDLNVQVIGTPMAPIPEPETYAMLLSGLGLLGFMARRRKQKAA